MIIFLGQSKGSGDSKNEKKEKEGLHHSPAAAPPSTCTCLDINNIIYIVVVVKVRNRISHALSIKFKLDCLLIF